MEYYQAYYTRVGKQGQESGWQVAEYTPGLSKVALERFRIIAAGIIGQKAQCTQIPPEIFLLQSDERFTYLCHAVMDCPGEDDRGNSAVFGSIITKNEYFEACREPERIIGYDKEREKAESDYYSAFLKCIFSVLDRTDASLCICLKERSWKEYQEKCRAIIIRIMKKLPRVLRSRLTFSSAPIKGVKVYFSNGPYEEAAEYFDWERGSSNIEENAIDSLRFPDSEETVEEDGFFEELFKGRNNIDISVRLYDSVFRFFHKLPQTEAEDCMRELLAGRPLICPILYQYLRELFCFLSPYYLEDEVVEELYGLYDRQDDEKFREVFERVFLSRNREEKAESSVEKEKEEEMTISLFVKGKMAKAREFARTIRCRGIKCMNHFTRR